MPKSLLGRIKACNIGKRLKCLHGYIYLINNILLSRKYLLQCLSYLSHTLPSSEPFLEETMQMVYTATQKDHIKTNSKQHVLTQNNNQLNWQKAKCRWKHLTL